MANTGWAKLLELLFWTGVLKKNPGKDSVASA